jgi:hypothetical protein
MKSSHIWRFTTADGIEVVISDSVYEEFEAVCDRRSDIYPDFIDFLLEEEGEIEDFDPASRRTYFDSNDVTHIRNIQYELADADDRREVLYQLRQYVRAAEARIEYLEERFEDAVVELYPPLGLRFALDDLIDHSADVRVVTDAAAWAADGGSAILVTLDAEDILDRADEINEILRAEQGEDWALVFTVPDGVLDGTAASASREQAQQS